MTNIETIAYARAGLLGNPSDGYGGKTISFLVRNFAAKVHLSECDRIVFVPGGNDGLEFGSVRQFIESVREQGFDGGVRLLKAATVRFFDYCRHHNVEDLRPFKVSFSTNIPRQVGMAGSSAIVIAMLKGLSAWNEINIQPEVLASLALESERDLGIAAGLQDRVIQSLEGLVYMDFSQQVVDEKTGLTMGQYESLNPGLLHNLYVAFAEDQAESTEVLHNDLQQRFDAGDRKVINALKEIAELAVEGRSALESFDLDSLSKLINRNFDLRQSICNLNPGHVQMIQVARQCGASAKYCGSGGAIVGFFPDDESYERLESDLGELGCRVFKPRIH